MWFLLISPLFFVVRDLLRRGFWKIISSIRALLFTLCLMTTLVASQVLKHIILMGNLQISMTGSCLLIPMKLIKAARWYLHTILHSPGATVMFPAPVTFSEAVRTVDLQCHREHPGSRHCVLIAISAPSNSTTFTCTCRQAGLLVLPLNSENEGTMSTMCGLCYKSE